MSGLMVVILMTNSCVVSVIFVLLGVGPILKLGPRLCSIAPGK